MTRKRRKNAETKRASGQRNPLPLNAVSRVNLGDSFAEYDLLLKRPDTFVSTAASQAASDPARNKCFFIGRRGTGKTAIALRLLENERNVIPIYPQVFSPLRADVGTDLFLDAHQKPFKSLFSAFELALQFELVYRLLDHARLSTRDLPDFAARELRVSENEDFDLRVIRFVERVVRALVAKNDSTWLREIKRPKQLARAINDAFGGTLGCYSIVVDRIDESWEGTTENVVFLAAFMHACVEMTTRINCARSLLFLRENVFERVRSLDTEFARLETKVVGLNWTHEKLLELIERRLGAPFNTRPPLGGPMWDALFEEGQKARELVFSFCQNRPRDVLTYCKFALEAASSRNHRKVQIDDLLNARRRFSDSRLKDLSDEYDENYPQLQLLLNRFYGLGWRFTRRGVESFVKQLLLDQQVKNHCAAWIFEYTPPEQLVNLLFQIGFFGIVTPNGEVVYRSVGPQTTTTPAITASTDFEIHPAYRDALDLQDLVVGAGDEEIKFGRRGFIEELPGALSLDEYNQKLVEIEHGIRTLPCGAEHATVFEDLVGEVIRLCLFRALTNVEPKVRNMNGVVVRDWIASNRAHGGFWEMVRIKHGAVQIVWECKNYEHLKADDFHQIAYYMNDEIGRFAIIVFRGDVKPSHWRHLERIAKDKKGATYTLSQKQMVSFMSIW